MSGETFIHIGERSLSGAPAIQSGGLILRTNSFRRSVIGGPIDCSITAFGSINKLFDLAELLRCPVTIYDRFGDWLWWGFVDTVQIRVDAMEVGITLSNMANKVAVEYNVVVPGEATVGEAYLTDWAQNDKSVATYGTREIIASLADTTQQAAEAFRDTLLASRGFPLPAWYMSGAQGSMSATLLCKGWWSTLDWLFYENTTGMEAYEESGEGVQAVGDVAANTMVRQSLQLSSGQSWYSHEVHLRMRRSGSPADNVVVSLTDGVTTLATATAPAASLPTDYNWVKFVLSTAVLLSPATTYYIAVSRSGALDASNFALVNVNEELGYANGDFRIYNGSTWVSRSPDADMQFRLIGVVETTQQVVTLESAVGQFLTGVKLDIDSGIYSCPYRIGDSSGLTEIMPLLNAGTSNLRRMLAEVTPSRILRIYEEPAKPHTCEKHLLSTGRVTTKTGTLLPAYKAPVGEWVEIFNVVPPTFDSGVVGDFTKVFIEEFEFSFESGVATLHPKSVTSPFDVGLTSLGE